MRNSLWFALSGFVALAAATPAAADGAPKVFADCSDCPEMVVVPAGTFKMGAEGGEEGRPEGPIRDIAIARPFALGSHEVTVDQFERFATETGYQAVGDCRSWVASTTSVELIPGSDFHKPSPDTELHGTLPVTCVAWSGAKAYVAWLSARTGQSYRLPTEAEWEYAARAGSSAAYPWGGKAEDGCAYANLYDEAGRKPELTSPVVACNDGHIKASPVKSLKPNAFGLYDMIGNVWEWTQDCYVAPYPAAAPKDGSAYELSGPCPRRSVRGGSWMTAAFRDRAAWRGRDPEEQESWIFGFRIARDLSPSEAK
ncbi:formylglycine-generating enzyme family protein [Sphingobium boeckii]|uniref:Formylglycine-generating enzyme required for sulfatase activity n=1 Tax=Sphingobium boeckii TaxID=1082345 RepID=A0A7W9AG30_9SPHN|nr:formylglycine-generating enzyme family protein [Sphingobium boeckii]MBB5684928.1 formylglycine-generating enzyme required for sulfatase activity [Sphingobium boeckii]